LLYGKANLIINYIFTLQEFIEGSIKNLYFLLLAKWMGFRINGLILEVYPDSSTYGLLSFSTNSDGKSLRQRAISNAARIDLI
jgi:hypothetical protein